MRFGEAMLALGYQNTHSGNMSVRVGDEMVITKTGAMKGHLRESDLCRAKLDHPEAGLFQASSEVAKHLRVLRFAGALIHAHPFSPILLSYLTDMIDPLDAFGKRYLLKVPVLPFEFPDGYKEMEREIPRVLLDKPALVVKTHGPFVRGRTLNEAFFCLGVLVHSCAIIYDCLRLGIDRVRLPLVEYPALAAYDSQPEESNTADPALAGQLERCATDCFYLRLSPFHTGSLSVENGREMFYSPALAAPSGFPHSILRLEVAAEDEDYFASLHRAVFRYSSAKAALFTLSPEAMALALAALARGEDRIIPADAEGGILFPVIPVVTPAESRE